VKYYRSSAEKGFAQAEFNLARMYEKGKGVEKNMKLALDYYQRAANQGLLEAQQRLANSLSNF
jgi:TPR repeat protein